MNMTYQVVFLVPLGIGVILGRGLGNPEGVGNTDSAIQTQCARKHGSLGKLGSGGRGMTTSIEIEANVRHVLICRRSRSMWPHCRMTRRHRSHGCALPLQTSPCGRRKSTNCPWMRCSARFGNTLPIEDPASICSIATLNALADDIATARSKEDIDSKLHDFEQAKVTLNQLLTALKGSIRSIRSSWTRTTLDQKKERARLEKLEKAKQDKLAKEKEDLYKQWKTDEAKSALFELDVSAISQPLIQDPKQTAGEGLPPARLALGVRVRPHLDQCAHGGVDLPHYDGPLRRAVRVLRDVPESWILPDPPHETSGCGERPRVLPESVPVLPHRH